MPSSSFSCRSPLDLPERYRPEHFSCRPERSARYPKVSKVPSGPTHSRPLVSVTVTTPSWARINPFGAPSTQESSASPFSFTDFVVRPRGMVLTVTPNKSADTTRRPQPFRVDDRTSETNFYLHFMSSAGPLLGANCHGVSFCVYNFSAASVLISFF